MDGAHIDWWRASAPEVEAHFGHQTPQQPTVTVANGDPFLNNPFNMNLLAEDEEDDPLFAPVMPDPLWIDHGTAVLTAADDAEGQPEYTLPVSFSHEEGFAFRTGHVLHLHRTLLCAAAFDRGVGTGDVRLLARAKSGAQPRAITLHAAGGRRVRRRGAAVAPSMLAPALSEAGGAGGGRIPWMLGTRGVRAVEAAAHGGSAAILRGRKRTGVTRRDRPERRSPRRRDV